MTDRIYNTVVDDITRKIKSEGYNVLESAAYVHEHQPKYIVWANPQKKRAIKFEHSIQEEYFAMYIAEYSPVTDYTKNAYWLLWYNTYYDTDDLEEQEIENTIYNFLERYEDAIRRQSVSISKLDKERNITYTEEKPLSTWGKKILLSLALSLVWWMVKKHFEEDKYDYNVDHLNMVKQIQYQKDRDSVYNSIYNISNKNEQDSLGNDANATQIKPGIDMPSHR